MNPDWRECGDLTDRFAKSQFDNCPGCGQFEQLQVMVVGEDYYTVVGCSPCGWQAGGKTPSEAIDNWNRRHELAESQQLREQLEKVSGERDRLASDKDLFVMERQSFREQLAAKQDIIDAYELDRIVSVKELAAEVKRREEAEAIVLNIGQKTPRQIRYEAAKYRQRYPLVATETLAEIEK